MSISPNRTEMEEIYDCLAGGGEMGARMRAFDWSRTPLGPVERWPQSLRTAVSICLNSKFPMVIWWGPELTLLYNDAWRPILGENKDRRALGSPGRAIWPEVWDVIGPMFESVMTTGQATWSDDGLLLVNRYGYTEEAYFTWSYSPIRDAAGRVGGVFTAVTETTERVIGARRLQTLRDLAARSVEAREVAEVCHIVTETLAVNPFDIPFALLYLIDEKSRRARLAGAAGVAAGASVSPAAVDLNDTSGHLWPFAQVVESGRTEFIEDLSERFAELPRGAWPDAPRSALVLPITLPGRQSADALLVAAVSPRRALDESYRYFFDRVAGQIAATLADARGYEEERRRAEALAELDRAKTNFFSNVSHEFRTPLTLLLGPLEDALAAEQAVAVRERLEIAHRNGLRLLKLVNTLLDFSRLEAGRMEAVYEPTNLAALTAELAGVFCSAVERAGLRLIVNCPPLGEPVWVDREMWEKIVLNLLSNALKFTFAGEIEVSLKQAGESVELTVRDTGTGIPAEELPLIFERFHRVRGARGRTFEGSGIGLALVRELAQMHGGSVRVESEVDRGSTFTVSIPRGHAHLPAERLNAARTLTSTSVGGDTYVAEVLRWLPEARTADFGLRPADGRSRNEGASGRVGAETQSTPHATTDNPPSAISPQPSPISQSQSRILLADDNADMREYVRQLLVEDGHEVEAVADGAAALAAARAHPPDLVLADVMMPQLDGFALLGALRADERTRELPVILLSARAGEEAKVEGLEAGADDYLVKPFTAKELSARVRAHLRLQRVRREAQEALRASEAKFATAFGQSPLALTITTLDDGRIIEVNEGFVQLSGYTREEAIGRTPEELGLWIEPKLRAERFARLRTGERVPNIEARFRTKDGREQVGVIGSALVEINSRLCVLSSVADITERKRMEEALRRQNERLSILSDALAGLLTTRSLDRLTRDLFPKVAAHLGVDTYFNYIVDEQGGALKLQSCAGISEEELPRMERLEFGQAICGTVAQIRQPIVATNIQHSDYEKAALVRSFGIQAYACNPLMGGNRLLGTLSFASRTRTHFEEDELEFLQLISRYVALATERVQTENSLRESEERFRNMADHAPVMIWVTEPDGRRTYLNRAWYEFTGQSPEEALGFGWLDAVHPNDRLQAEEAFLTAKERREVFRIEYRLRRTDDGYGWVIDSAAPRFGPGGEFLGYIGSVIDITERKHMEEALREADQRKDEFLAMLAHELRNPLAPIRNAAQVLKLVGPADANQQWAREVIERQVVHLTRLVDDLLDVSRITSGKVTLRRETIELSTIISRAVETSRPLIDARRHHLSVTQAPRPVRVEGDLTRLVQVVGNLLNNAAKYTNEGGHIQLSAALEGKEAVIRVRDNGMGVPAELLPFVFDLFTQADRSLDRSQGGLGIGLTLVRSLVELHGGRVEARSDGSGRGSEFTIRLPAVQIEERGATEEKGAGARAALLTSLTPHLRVLVVEDNVDSAEMLSFMLKLGGYETRIAHDGLSALATAGDFRPQVVLCDIGLPGMNGYEVARRLRAQPELNGVLLIALTGYGQEEDRRRAREAGFDHHLTKPFDPDALAALLTSSSRQEQDKG